MSTVIISFSLEACKVFGGKSFARKKKKLIHLSHHNYLQTNVQKLQCITVWMNEKETKTVDTSFSTPLQIHNTLDSQWRRSGTYCNFLDNFCGDSLLKSAHDQTSNHKVVWTVGDRLRLHHVPLINGTKTNDNPHAQVNGRESNFADVESKLENSAMGSGKERKEKVGNENQEAERTFAFAKLQDVRITASVALREAIDARDQTLQARKEALAARREAIEAQKEAMRARNEALMIRTEMSEARRTLTEVTKAITTMLEEVQQIHAKALGKILDQRAHKELQKKCVRDNEIDTLVATENGIYATKKVLFDKVKQEEDKKDLLNSLSLVKSSRSKSPLVVEPHIIVTNSQTMKTKHACHTVPDTLSEDIYSKNLPKTSESSPNKRSRENLNIRLSKVRESEIDAASGACVDNDINVSCKDTDLVKHMKLPETGDMLSDFKQNIGDPSKNCKKDSSIRRHIEENDSISKESDDSEDDLTDAEEGDLKKTAPEM